jgi:hypothetical protein
MGDPWEIRGNSKEDTKIFGIGKSVEIQESLWKIQGNPGKIERGNTGRSRSGNSGEIYGNSWVIREQPKKGRRIGVVS